jgi:hypothetical protein
MPDRGAGFVPRSRRALRSNRLPVGQIRAAPFYKRSRRAPRQRSRQRLARHVHYNQGVDAATNQKRDPTNGNDRSHSENTERPLTDRLRTTLDAARGNMEIRERLKALVEDPRRFDPIVKELGARHGLVRELLAIARHGEPAANRAA